MEYTDKGVAEMIQKLGKDFEDFEFLMALDEINCSDKKMRTLSLTHYSKEGKLILTRSKEREWDYIVPGSIGETIYKTICK